MDSSKSKLELHARLIHAKSLKEAIDLLRNKLVEHKAALSDRSKP